MSGFRDGLEQWALSRGDEVAAHIEPTEAATRGAIRTRRRRRAAAIAGGTLAGVVAVAAIASALPRPAVEPAGTYQSHKPAMTLEAGQVPARLSCGVPWTLDQGLTRYTETSPGEVTGDWTVVEDGGAVHADATSLWAGYEVLEWHQTGSDLSPDHGMMLATVVAVDDGEVVGVAPATGSEVVSGASEFGMTAPLPGRCGDDETGKPDGTYEFHVVTQLLDAEGAPVATWVDPAGPASVDIRELEGLLGPYADPDAPAELRDPQGDKYQAFLVTTLDFSACRPFQDQRDAGQPTAASLQYTVTLPGVRPLTGGMWDGAPVAIVDESVKGEWYAADPAWLVADDVGDMYEPLVEWSDDRTVLASEDGWQSVSHGPDCAPATGVQDVSGAVFLVINGVDWNAFIAANPTASLPSGGGAQTWVYLGQAQN